MICPHCASTATKKNGLTFYKKQNYKCGACGRQFVENGQAYFVSEATKSLVNKLLLERLSLAGIRRVCGVSESWLHTHLKRLYANQPDDLGASQTLPPVEEYLAERLDEEIERLLARKKKTIVLPSD